MTELPTNFLHESNKFVFRFAGSSRSWMNSGEESALPDNLIARVPHRTSTRLRIYVDWIASWKIIAEVSE